MSDQEDIRDCSIAAVCITAAIVIGIWAIGWIGSGIGQWWQYATYVSPEQKAEARAEEEAWAKDARNPAVAGQACIDAGGVPKYSNWDGDVTSCTIVRTPISTNPKKESIR